MKIFIIISLIINAGLLVSYIIFGFISIIFFKQAVIHTKNNVSSINPNHTFYLKSIKYEKISTIFLRIVSIYGPLTLIIAFLYLGYIF